MQLEFSYEEIIQDQNKFKFIKAPRQLTELLSTYLSISRRWSGVVQIQLQSN